MSSSQTELPIPTVQVKLASESRKATFLARLETLARVERMVGMAEVFVIDKTRKIAVRVRGAMTGWMLAVVKLLIVRLNVLMDGPSVDFLETRQVVTAQFVTVSRYKEVSRYFRV